MGVLAPDQTAAKEKNPVSAKDIYARAAEAFNKHDARTFAALYAPDAVVYDPTYPQPLKGRDAILQDFTDFVRAFPDAQFELLAVLEDGREAAGEFRVSGNHNGPLALPTGEVPATGKPLSFGGGAFSRFNDQGEIVEEHRYFDVAGQLSQLGLV